MASDKKRRKAARQARKQQLPRTGPFRHPNGDRRNRGRYMTYEQAMAIKKMLHQGEAEATLREDE